MRLIPVHTKRRPLAARDLLLTGARLRRPTKLPTVVPTTLLARWLRRLGLLIGGG